MAEPVLDERQAGHENLPEDVYASWSPSSSPDGSRVAFVSDRGGEPAVWIQAGPAVRPLTQPGQRLGRVRTVHWSPDGEWLACEIDALGASRTEVWVVRPSGEDARPVAGAAPGTAVLAGSGGWHGWTASGQLMVSESDGGSASAVLVNPVDGQRSVLASDPLLRLLDVQPIGSGPRALIRIGSRGRFRLAVVDAAGRRMVPLGDGPGFAQRGFLSPGGETVYAVSNVGREFAGLVAVPLSGPGPLRVVASRPGADLESAVPSRDGRLVVLVWNVDGGRSAVSLLDLSSGEDHSVPTLPRDVVDEGRLRPDGAALLLTAEDWADPRGVWSVDLVTFEATSLSQPDDGTLRASRGATAERVEISDLISPSLRRLRARDGLELSGWLYRLAGGGPGPSVVYLHGGPESQERPIYNSLFQSLVSAGIAVFALNYRGSSGLGRSFQAADDLEKRFAAITDVADAAEHLVDTGIAEPGRIACMGRSYGGYLTRAALVWHPSLFAAGVDVCGMSNFDTFYRYTEPWISADAVSEYGDPVTDSALLQALSPIHRMDALKAPLLVVHGAQDTNVPVHEAEQVVSVLAERGVEHRFLLFEGEGHELLATPNRVAFVQAALDWLTRHLGADL